MKRKRAKKEPTMSKKTIREPETDETAGDAPFVAPNRDGHFEQPSEIPPVLATPPKRDDDPSSPAFADSRFVPFWREGRLGKANVETRNKPPEDPNAYARSTGQPMGTMRPVEAVTVGKDNPDEFPYPAAFKADCEDAERQLRAITAKGSSDSKSIWDSLQARSRRKKLGDVREAGVLVPTIVSAWTVFNDGGGFENAHESGNAANSVWSQLLEGHIGVPPTVAGEDPPPVYDVRAAYLRLEEGRGYAGNMLTPTAVPEAEVCVWARPKGYETADPLTVLFVFAYSLDEPRDPKYADPNTQPYYPGMTPQQVLDFQKNLRGGNRAPSGLSL